MNFKIDLLGDLRQKFIFLTFMTDKEVEQFFTIVGSVARGTSVNPDEILNMVDEQSRKNVAFC
jgi:hypothetical protein